VGLQTWDGLSQTSTALFFLSYKIDRAFEVQVTERRASYVRARERVIKRPDSSGRSEAIASGLSRSAIRADHVSCRPRRTGNQGRHEASASLKGLYRWAGGSLEGLWGLMPAGACETSGRPRL
jgi:hypothetical protein